jgi:hypothetical protein
MGWAELILVEHELQVGPNRRRILARIGSPRHFVDHHWARSIRSEGTGDKRRELGHREVDRAISTNGLHAPWNACYPIRYLLDRLKDVHPSAAT